MAGRRGPPEDWREEKLASRRPRAQLPTDPGTPSRGAPERNLIFLQLEPRALPNVSGLSALGEGVGVSSTRPAGG